MKSSFVSEQSGAWEVYFTPNGEVKKWTGLAVIEFLSQRTAEVAILLVFEVDGE